MAKKFPKVDKTKQKQKKSTDLRNLMKPNRIKSKKSRLRHIVTIKFLKSLRQRKKKLESNQRKIMYYL